MQNRAKTGVDFEKSVQVNGWVKKTSSPRMKWCGEGQTIFDKIKSVNYDPTRFILDETNDLSKYDIYHPETEKYREVKKYRIESFDNWLLYSEPYFKMSTKRMLNKISVDVYNKFAKEFYELHKDSGFFERVIKKINDKSEGIQIIDGFIPKEELEFRTVLYTNCWAGYYRITIEVRRNEV